MRIETEATLDRAPIELIAGKLPLAGLPPFEFATSQLPPQEQFAAWQNSFSPMLDLAEHSDSAVGFAGRQLLWDWGNLAFARIKTDALNFSSLPRHLRRDPLDHWTLTILLRGHMDTVTPGSTFQASAGTVQVHALGRDFAGNVSNSEMIMLFIPRDADREMASALSGAEFSTLQTGMGRLLSDYLIDVAKRMPLLDTEDLPGLVAATRAMILACISLSATHIEEAQAPIATALLDRARQLIQARLFEPDLDAEMLRRELGISRTRLYNLFEASGGVVRYIQRRRLLDAHAVLADPNDRRRILEVAEQRGFSDGAEFSRAFRREFGYSPSEVRKGQKTSGGCHPQPALEAAAPIDRLGILLRRLQG